MPGGDFQRLHGSVYRLFSDSNDNRSVDAVDFHAFLPYFGGVNSSFDFDGDGSVSASDFIQFRQRFGGSI